MSAEYSYDGEGQFFPFFFVSIAALIVTPVTWSALKPSTELENTATRIASDYKIKDADFVDEQRKRQKKKERKFKRGIFALLGWLFIALNIYLVVTTQRLTPKIWDPYEILGIASRSDEKAIKRMYRKLSTTLHPDKAQPDAAKNETMDTVNDRWVEIVKAYKALTDEDVKKNYEEFGNPDGKQSTSIGIALPQFLVQEGNGKYVMIVYGALIGILLPYVVGSWWYGSQKLTKDNVLVSSVGKLFKEFSERLDEGGVVAALSVGDEYQEELKGHKADTGLGQIEKRVLATGSTTRTAAGLTTKEANTLKELDDSSRRKALALLWAFLGRIELDDATLNEEKFAVGPTALALNDAFLSICLAYQFTTPTLAAYKTSQSILQAMPPHAPPLLQLPHLSRETIQKIEEAASSSQRKHLTVQGFMGLADSHRRELTKNAGLNSSQYSEIVKVASQLPRLVVEKTFFKVAHEKHITPSSLVNFVVKARFIPPGSKNVPALSPAELEDMGPEKRGFDASGESPDDNGEEDYKYQPPLAHAPFLGRDHSPRWNLFLGDARQGKIAVPPFTFEKFTKPIFTADGKPTFAVQTLKMTFQAPPGPGEYRFQMHLLCDSYVGFDDKREVRMTIVDESEISEPEVEEDEISEPDEDSLAGQMAALKGNAPGPKKPRRKPVKKDVDESSEDESGTDEDKTSDSETDTDTDSEAE